MNSKGDELEFDAYCSKRRLDTGRNWSDTNEKAIENRTSVFCLFFFAPAPALFSIITVL